MVVSGGPDVLAKTVPGTLMLPEQLAQHRKIWVPEYTTMSGRGKYQAFFFANCENTKVSAQSLYVMRSLLQNQSVLGLGYNGSSIHLIRS